MPQPDKLAYALDLFKKIGQSNNPYEVAYDLEREGFANIKREFADRTRVMAREDVDAVFKVQLTPQYHYDAYASTILHHGCNPRTHRYLPEIYAHRDGLTLLEKLGPFKDRQAADDWKFDVQALLLEWEDIFLGDKESYMRPNKFKRRIIAANPTLLRCLKVLVTSQESETQIALDDMMSRKDGTYVILEPMG